MHSNNTNYSSKGPLIIGVGPETRKKYLDRIHQFDKDNDTQAKDFEALEAYVAGLPPDKQKDLLSLGNTLLEDVEAKLDKDGIRF